MQAGNTLSSRAAENEGDDARTRSEIDREPVRPQPATTRGRVLLVEDDIDLAFGLKLNLEVEGLEVHVESNGLNALPLLSTFQPDVVILDIMLPGMDGFELLRRWRAFDRTTRIIILSAKASEADRVAGLRLGADDYVIKPFSVIELMERVRIQLHRRVLERPPARVVKLGSVSIDLMSRTVTRGAESTKLTSKEFGLFLALLDANGAVVSQQTLLQIVWESKAAPGTNTVEYHVSVLRRKIEDDPSHPRYLLTVRGTGYRLLPP